MGGRLRTVAVLAAVSTMLALAPTGAFAVTHLLAYAQGSRIWVSQPNGSHRKRLGRAGDQVVISPDGLEVATVRQGKVGGNIPFYVSVYPIAGGAAKNFLTTAYQPTAEPGGIVGFSADSRYLAISTASDIVVVDTTTGTIAATLQGALSASWAPKLPDRLAPVGFNAGGTRLLIAFGPSDYSPPGYANRIVTTTLSGTGIQTLVREAGSPSWNF